MTSYGLVVIGGGAAGLAAARAAARKRSRPLLVSDGPIGGDCTFTGCVPSKTLLAAAARGESFTEALAGVRATVERIAATESAIVLREEGIDVHRGRAVLRAGGIDVDGARIDASRIVLAAGSRPAVPSIEGLDSIRYLTNENVFDLERLPGSMVVVGGGAIGCELAQAFARFGARVTVVEAADRLLPEEEPEASVVLHKVFSQEGIDVRTEDRVEKVESVHAGSRLLLASGTELEAAAVLVTVGRRPPTDDLGLRAAGVETDEDGWVRVDDKLATTAAGIWAAGDITTHAKLTHVADEMGRIAAGNALGGRRRFDGRVIPRVVFTDPEVASVGLMEAQAAGNGARVAMLPMSEVDRAITEGREAGFVKLIGGPRPILRNVGGGRLLGATIVAARGGELVHEAALALQTKMFLGRLAQTVHAYPTWSIAVRQTAAQFFGRHGGRTARPAVPTGSSDAIG